MVFLHRTQTSHGAYYILSYYSSRSHGTADALGCSTVQDLGYFMLISKPGSGGGALSQDLTKATFTRIIAYDRGLFGMPPVSNSSAYDCTTMNVAAQPFSALSNSCSTVQDLLCQSIFAYSKSLNAKQLCHSCFAFKDLERWRHSRNFDIHRKQVRRRS